MPALTLLPLPSYAEDCINHWINPQTGHGECLDQGIGIDGRPRRGMALVRSSAEYLNRLKTCQPTIFTHPFPLNPEVTVRLASRGRVGDRCQVEYAFVPPPNEGKEWLYLRCRFSQPALALLTDQQAYAEASALESGSFSFNSSNPRTQKISQLMNQECQFFEPPN